jgi:hypothetical protein
LEKEIRKEIPFMIAPKKLQHLRIILMNEVNILYNENYKSLKKEINETIRRRSHAHGSAESIL